MVITIDSSDDEMEVIVNLCNEVEDITNNSSDEEMEVDNVQDDPDDVYNVDYDGHVNNLLDAIENDIEINNVQEEGGFLLEPIEDQDVGLIEEHEEIQPSEDSDYGSDCDEESSDVQFIDTVQLRSIDSDSRVCVIYSYNIPWQIIELCNDCFMRNKDVFTNMWVIQRHETKRYRDIQHQYCHDCRAPLYIIFQRNICPVCN